MNGDLRHIQNSIEQNLATKVQSIIFNDSPGAMNSQHGFLTLQDGTELFFKTHPHKGVIQEEADHITLLKQYHYPILEPRHIVTTADQEILLFEKIPDLTLFDWMQKRETYSSLEQERMQDAFDSLVHSIFFAYKDSLASIPASKHAKAPIHRLFSQRLSGERFINWYQKVPFRWGENASDFEHMKQWEWEINGQKYSSLETTIDRARILFAPEPTVSVATIIGHGDSHNANVFLRGEEDQYCFLFDPAFAGRHSPWLDMAKPLFHNTWAEWMYFPEQVSKKFQVSWKLSGSTLVVEHNYSPDDLQQYFFKAYNQLLIPQVRNLLEERGLLEPDWQKLLSSALFACAFLTVNLNDDQKYPEKIRLLGMTLAVEMAEKQFLEE